MKKHLLLTIVCGLLLFCAFTSCIHHHNTSISISDSYDEYRMSASYEKHNARKVLRFLEERLEEDGPGISLSAGHADEWITLDDNTRFYLYSRPGELRIKIDKNQNSGESCLKVREICEGIKDLLARN